MGTDTVITRAAWFSLATQSQLQAQTQLERKHKRQHKRKRKHKRNNRMSTNENEIRHKHNTSKIMRTFLVLELTLVLMPPSRPISNVCACPCVASENQAEMIVKKYKVQFKLKNRVKA